jgi:nucleoside-diphosphate-sugar epimerase
VQGEELLRTDCCAIILRVAGIYGPGRNPIDWIRKGRVSPSRKYVNLIHVEDLADICLITMERGMRGDAYNVSDGTPRTWKDICRIVQDRWGIQPSEEKGDASIGKRIATGKLLSLLGNAHTVLAHSDFYRSLERLQSGRPVT